MKNTICALSTPRGRGATAVIRVSGSDAFKIVKKIFSSRKDLESAASHTLIYGFIHDKGKKIDEVLISVFKAPRSFTGENVCEISCHGGAAVYESILDILIKNGARMAERGEFTKRAFMNGKLSLTQAEAVKDIIDAKTSAAAGAAVNRLGGALSEKIISIREKIVRLLAQIQVSADFPDEETDSLSGEGIRKVMAECEKELEGVLKTAVRGIFLAEGARCAIAGIPNTGKSSLLNALLCEEKAIVTSMPGTTRDSVEGFLEIGGVLVTFYDTAGIRETEDIVEKIGVDKAKNKIKDADFVIFVTECGRCLTEEEEALLKQIDGSDCIKVLNKCDIFNEKRDGYITLSAKEGVGTDELKEKIGEFLRDGEGESAMIANERQREALSLALDALKRAEKTLDDGFFADLAAIDLEDSARCLGEVEGMSVNDEVVDRIFKDFCLGK